MKSPSKKALKAKTWKVFSIWVRSHTAADDGTNECYTCGRRYDWKYELQAGHYRHDSHDFDERNIHPQCVYCNKYLHGNLDNYYAHLVKDYGKKVADELRLRKKWNDYSIEDMQKVLSKYSI